MRQIIKDALKIGELEESLNNISHDDGCEIENYKDYEIVEEAKYVLSTFNESGHNNNAWLHGDDGIAGPCSEARAQYKALKRFIAKYQ